jgi:hypothetical protein
MAATGEHETFSFHVCQVSQQVMQINIPPPSAPASGLAMSEFPNARIVNNGAPVAVQATTPQMVAVQAVNQQPQQVYAASPMNAQPPASPVIVVTK